jgi:hypothetical protein
MMYAPSLMVCLLTQQAIFCCAIIDSKAMMQSISGSTMSIESSNSLYLLGQGACVKKLSGKAKLEDSRATKQIVALLSAPLEKYSNIVTALELSNYPRVMDYLDNATTKVMAVVIIQSIMKNTTCISTSDKVIFQAMMLLLYILLSN